MSIGLLPYFARSEEPNPGHARDGSRRQFEMLAQDFETTIEANAGDIARRSRKTGHNAICHGVGRETHDWHGGCRRFEGEH
jgi:hypothetical protein